MTRRIAVLVTSVLVLVSASLPLVGAQANPAKSDRPNIVEVAASAPQFSTLVALVKQAGLAGALAKPGELTVFAPTNAAFAALKKAHPKLFNEVAHSKQLLKDVLLYHVVAGRLLAKQVVAHRTLKTLLGQRVKIAVRDGQVYVNQAKVVKVNVLASNGVIHAINAVLLPKLG